MLKADIRFGNGAIFTCVGRVVNGKIIPWIDAIDLTQHVKYINDKNPDLPNKIEVIRIYNEENL